MGVALGFYTLYYISKNWTKLECSCLLIEFCAEVYNSKYLYPGAIVVLYFKPECSSGSV